MKKALTLGLAFTVFMQSTAFAAASSKKEEPKPLSVKEASNLAYQHSSSLRKTEESAYLTELQRPNIESNITEAQTETQLLKAWTSLMQNELDSAMSYINIENQKKSIEITITNYFASIIAAERELEIYDKQLALDKKELEIKKTKAELGMLNKTDFDSATLAYEKSVANRATKAQVLSDAYKSLNQAMGQSLSKQYSIELDLSYETLRKVNIDSYVTQSIDSNPKVKEATRKLEISQYEYDATVYDTDYDKESAEVNLTQSKRNLNDTKKSIEDSIITAYDSIQSLELSYTNAVADYESMKKQLEIKKVQLELGKITQLDVDKYEQSMLEAQYSILKTINNHAIKVMEFNNPQLY